MPVLPPRNIDWLIAGGYYYLVVNRERNRQFDHEQGVGLTTASGDTVHCQKILSDDGKEAHLYCYSEARGEKEQAMTRTFSTLFETALNNLADGLHSVCAQRNVPINFGSASVVSKRSIMASVSTTRLIYSLTKAKKKLLGSAGRGKPSPAR